MSVPVKGKFDPSNAAHLAALITKVAESHGTGWEVQSFDSADSLVVLTRRTAVTQVERADPNVGYKVSLRRGVRPTDGDKIAAELESDPRHVGYFMTRFDPFLGEATLSKMSEESRRCRAAVAVALGVKPWDVQVRPRTGGGFELDLPQQYVASKHDDKLLEVAETVVGRPGWYVKTDAASRAGQIVPSSPPTFQPVISYALSRLARAQRDRTPFAVALAETGDAEGTELAIDWGTASFAMVAGIPQSGKSVTLNALIAGQLAGGAQLVIVDTPEKSVDFLWMKDLVRPHGWGCDSLEAAVTALALIYEEGQRRAAVVAEAEVVNWLELPPTKQFSPILVVADELSALLVTEKVPTGVPKDNPFVQEIIRENTLKVMLARYINKILAEMRFVGIRMILSTQITNNSTGLGPSMKGKIGHKLLQGANPSKTQREQAFNDATAVPAVPDNIRSDSKAARGVGVAEIEGVPPTVYKTMFASTSDYRQALLALRLPLTNSPSPSEAQIGKHTPQEDYEDGEPPSRIRPEHGGFGRDGGRRPAREDGLKGAAAAAHDLRVAEAQARRASAHAG